MSTQQGKEVLDLYMNLPAIPAERRGDRKFRNHAAVVFKDHMDRHGYSYELFKVALHNYTGKSWAVSDIMKACLSGRSSNNLLSPNEFYYHNRLRLQPGPPKVWIDDDTGEVLEKEEPWFLEMRKSLYLPELLDYYYEQCGVPARERNLERDLGRLAYLLTKYSVDELLFIIDVAAYNLECEDQAPPANLIDLQKWGGAGLAAREAKANQARLDGSDQLVPRQTT